MFLQMIDNADPCLLPLLILLLAGIGLQFTGNDKTLRSWGVRAFALAFLGYAGFGFYDSPPSDAFDCLGLTVKSLFAGGLVLGAFFMATDMVTTPSSPLGQWIFGFGCGLLTIVIRLVGGYPEGVSYSILLMNLVTPLLDRYTKPKVFGA